MDKIAIINGPNLNLLGKREKNIYGSISFEVFLDTLKDNYPKINFMYFQSNIEGEIVTKIQEYGFSDYKGIILNPAAYTHTSIAIADAVKAIKIPVIEVHISNIANREKYRHTSLITPFCKGSIIGFGLKGYRLAIESFLI
ncbi:MAG TPA: type II 3-dehydroquinate dehydratase [Flavobacteriia bacterium]|nr:type II 3-dehydroquinate dehydratase [Flavobacteriia bacterium]